MYAVFTTLMLVIAILSAVVFLVFVNNKLLELKENKNSELLLSVHFMNIRDRMFYCYGSVLDELIIASDPGCLGFIDNEGVSLEKLAYADCPAGHVKELGYRGYGRVERYNVPVLGPKNSVCPAVLTVYENAVIVPLILGLSLSPQIGLRGSVFSAIVEFYQTKYPSFIDLSVVDSLGSTALRLSDVSVAGNRTGFLLDSSSLLPGLYDLSVSSTYDREFYDVAQKIRRLRVVDPLDSPVIRKVVVNPKNGSMYDAFRIEVNLSDYVNVTGVTAQILLNGNAMDSIGLARSGESLDSKLLSRDFIFSAVWQPGSVPNENLSFVVSIFATNILGNTATLANAGVIELTQTGMAAADVLVVTNDRVYSTLLDLLPQYQSALLSDGYSSKVVRLDTDDVLGCNPDMQPAPGPRVMASDARGIIPQCILEYNSSYVIVLGGYAQIEQAYGGMIEGHAWYTDDYLADLDGDAIPDIPIGRLPDSDPFGDDTVRIALQTAMRMHEEFGWSSLGSHYAWTLDIPRGYGSPTVKHIECMVNAIDSAGATTCGSDPKCYFGPPYSSSSAPPPAWQSATDLVYVCGHGDEKSDPTWSGQQKWSDHTPVQAVMGTAAMIGLRDFTNSLLFYNPCLGGRINNLAFRESSVLNALHNRAVAVFAGTTLQSYPVQSGACTWPIGDFDTGSELLANTAFNINKGNARTLGDGWLAAKRLCKVRSQRENNQMYGDPSIRVT